jgi:predicted CXXCH cytochrome family protein
MKKYVMLVLCILMGMLLVASMSMATTLTNAGKGIKSSEHDLSTTGAGKNYGDALEKANTLDGGNRICIYCHAPHHTIKAAEADGINYIPLWNHEVTVQDYVLYSNGTDLPNDLSHQSQAMVLLAGKTKPGAVSRLCLSCHDGTVSTNSYGFTPAPPRSVGAGGIDVKNTEYLIGGSGDLTNHHPIGFNYDAVQVKDNEIKPSATTLVGATGLNISNLLWNGNMECTTCHDVHNTKSKGERFLWTSDGNSAFCLTCHDKGSQVY